MRPHRLRKLKEPPGGTKGQQACGERGLSGRRFTPKRRGDLLIFVHRPQRTLTRTAGRTMTRVQRHPFDASRIPLTISLPGRRPTAVLTFALSMATVVVWLAPSPPTMAQGPKGACQSPSTAHPKRSANVCVHSGRKRKAHVRSKAKRHHAKHTVGKKKAKKEANANPPTAPKLWIDPVTLPVTARTIPVEGNAAESTASPFSILHEQEASRLQFVKTPVSPYGALCLRAEVQQHDLDPVERDRVQLDATAYTYRPGQDFWLAYAIQLDSSFPSVNEVQWTKLAEMIGHPSAGKATSSFALEIFNDKWRMSVRGGSRKAEERDKRIHYALLTNAPATKGVWHEFLFHLVLAKDESGKVDGYHRQFGEAWPSTPSVSDTGVNVITVEGVDIWPYPALQVYRATRPEAGIAYFGGFRLRATRVEAEGLFKRTG